MIATFIRTFAECKSELASDCMITMCVTQYKHIYNSDKTLLLPPKYDEAQYLTINCFHLQQDIQGNYKLAG